MSKKVKIDILGAQRDEDGQDDWVELSTQATLTHAPDGAVTLEYAEGAEMDETQTTVTVYPGRVSIKRVGQYNSTMVFEKNTPYTALYQTPYGAFSMGILASTVETKVTDDSVHLNIVYDIDFGASCNQNRLEIKTSKL